MAHRREIDGEDVLFGNHGALYGNALTMFDHATGSVWSQVSGQALLGPLAGERLELLPSTLTDWGTWRREHPGTSALDADGGRSRFDVDDTRIAIEFGEQSLAVPVAELREHGVANIEVDGPGRWDGVRGLPEDGGEVLDPLGALTIFPRDYEVHFPDGQVWSP